jgi:uroporphyrinogen-III decarboxylase
MMAEAQVRFWKEIHYDMLLVENGVVAEAQACGCGIEYFDDGSARIAVHVLADGLEKVEELDVPDPFTTHPMCEVIKTVRILCQELGDRVFIMGRADQGPVALALALRGYQQFLIDLARFEQPELIHRVLDYCVKVQTRYALALKEAGAHGTATNGAGVDIIGPNLYRQIEHPFGGVNPRSWLRAGL